MGSLVNDLYGELKNYCMRILNPACVRVFVEKHSKYRCGACSYTLLEPWPCRDALGLDEGFKEIV